MKVTRKKGDRFEVYITKYALSSGVKMCLVESVGDRKSTSLKSSHRL